MRWTKEKCGEEGLKYKTPNEFRVNNRTVYEIILKNKWMDELCPHLAYKPKFHSPRTKEECLEEALKYKTRTEFRTNSASAYNKAKKEKWLDEISFYFPPKYVWTKDNCLKEALKYKTRTEFIINNTTVYSNARKNKWLDEICGHMTWLRQPEGYWTYETCKEVAKKYDNRFDFSYKSSHAYLLSTKNGWLDEFIPPKIHKKVNILV